MDMVTRISECATLFYQNREAEAYQLLSELLPVMNQALQEMAADSKEYESIVALIMQQFIEAYQQKDQLALADILEYAVANVIEVGTGE